MDIEIAIHKWFDMNYITYDKLEHDNSIYLYYQGNKYADIRINNDRKVICFNPKLLEEFCTIFPSKRWNFNEFICDWVELKFNMEPNTITHSINCTRDLWLKVPSN